FDLRVRRNVCRRAPERLLAEKRRYGRAATRRSGVRDRIGASVAGRVPVVERAMVAGFAGAGHSVFGAADGNLSGGVAANFSEPGARPGFGAVSFPAQPGRINARAADARSAQ